LPAKNRAVRLGGMKKKSYQQVLEMDENSTAISQFGWLPISIFKGSRALEWKGIIGDAGDHKAKRSENAEYLPGLRFSEFNPELAEMVIRYWSLEGNLVIDPFAGRGTRGIVALEWKRKYQGYEVAPRTFATSLPNIVERGGSLECLDGCILAHTLNESADLIFTCPPYHQLERYQSAAAQLSDITDYAEFLNRIRVCAKNCFRVLKAGKFACWVCADWRDEGCLRLFHVDSISAFKEQGFRVHDVVIVENISPFAPLQAGKVSAKRYTTKVHEYLLVFRKPEYRELRDQRLGIRQ